MFEDTFAVVLVRPENHENIGLVARNMKNTGFKELRLVGVSMLEEKSFITAVHSKDVLESAQFFPDLDTATADCQVVFASTSKERKNFSSLSLEIAVAKMCSYPPEKKIGLLFGNERTGLTSEELCHSNFRFTIPQATAQPSYNLAAAVLISLFRIFTRENLAFGAPAAAKPLSRHDQEECIKRILMILEEKSFIHPANKKHVHEMIYDLFGRLVLTEKDRNLLLAIFSKGVG
ncbi:RNA methyltransferase [Acidobacteriota bacterium]